MKQFSINSTVLCLITALYMALCCNFAFFGKVQMIVQSNEPLSIPFIVSVPFVLVAILNALLLPFSFQMMIKPLFAVFIVLSAIFNFASYEYGIIFNDEMFRNIVQTDYGEAMTYLTPSFIFAVIVTGVIPALIVVSLNVHKNTLRRAFGYKALSFVLSLLLVGIVAFSQFESYAAVGRNNRGITKQLTPIYPFKGAYKYIQKEYFTQEKPYVSLALDAHRNKTQKSAKKKLVLLALGETQRSMNYSLNGYKRDTNFYTKNEDVVSFQDVTSYGTATAISVPYIFSMASDKYEDSQEEKNRDNVVDVLTRAGVSVFWRDNDSGCKGACRGANYADMRKKYALNKNICSSQSCYDGLFKMEIKEMLQALPDNDSLVIFHLMGSHGPSYWQRYPQEFRRFTPDCPKNDIQNCTTEELVNTYDNTILYSDYVLSELIQTLRNEAPDRDVSIIFLSDHGESLGENGLYLHGMPRSLAPKEQIQVPLIVWFNKSAPVNGDCLQQKAKAAHLEKVNLADTLLGLMGISTQSYKSENDIFSSCRSI